MKKITLVFLSFILLTSITYSQENNFHNLRQLTDGGNNAEAYFSPDGKSLTLQIANPDQGVDCDRIYTLDLSIENPTFEDYHPISTGTGRTTCSFFMPDGKHILYSSTHDKMDACPTAPRMTDGKYLWSIYQEYDIYMADLEGNIVKRLTDDNGYDAEAVLSPDGTMIAFTSMRSGDMDIWIMDVDGSNKRQITHTYGYDGGAFFSHDSKKLVFRAFHPETEEEKAEYQYYLDRNLVAPSRMELFTVNVDGTDMKQITNLGKANWAPYFHPSNEKIIFSSNHHMTEPGHDFQIFIIDIDGKNLQQVTYESYFNSFPMFSPDGTQLVFSSNRNPDIPRQTDVFIADWVEPDPAEYTNVDNLKEHIEYLASDELEGRLVGTDNERKAADYIIEKLEEYKLKPYNNGEYLQYFEFNVRPDRHDSTYQVKTHGNNVIAVLDNKAEKTIVLGAHYDHLGRNEYKQSTKANSDGEIHNGADDNASGVAALLELTRIFSQNDAVENVNYIFAFFSGEEEGLMGSKHMAESLKDSGYDVIAMINLDMVGRLNEKKDLIISGTGTSPVFSDILQRNKPAGFHITEELSGVGPSDHTSFYLKDIPVLFFTTGNHVDYHKPSDTAEKINYYGMNFIVHYVFRVSNELSQLESIPFTKTKANAGRKAAKYKVTMGVMPNYSDSGDGLQIDGVMDGGTADKAGVEEGDVLIRIGDCKVKDIYGYMECLGELSAGDEVEGEFIRDGEKITLMLKF